MRDERPLIPYETPSPRPAPDIVSILARALSGLLLLLASAVVIKVSRFGANQATAIAALLAVVGAFFVRAAFAVWRKR